MICYLHTCYDDNCTGTWNIHAISLRNKLRTVPCVIIIQSHLYLFIIMYTNVHVKTKNWDFIQPFLAIYMYICLNLWPGERSLVAKVEYEAAVHYVSTFNPRNRFT